MQFKGKFSYVIFTGNVIILIRLFLLASQLKCSLFDLIRVYDDNNPKDSLFLFF